MGVWAGEGLFTAPKTAVKMGWEGKKADNIRPLVSCQMLLDKDIMFLTDVNTNSRIGSQDGSDMVIRFCVCVCVKIVL